MKQTLYNGWKNLETIQAKEIIYELADAKKRSLAKILVSSTGGGKTNSIKLFSKTNPECTYVITVGASYKLADVINEMLEVLEIKNEFGRFQNHNIRPKLKAIATRLRELKSSGKKPIIILDECENIYVQVLKMLKELYDAAHHYCAIVLIGTDQIMDAIHNKRNKNRQSVPQLWRRFKAGTRFITPLDKARDFKPFFQLYIPGALDVQDILLECCDNYGELHDYLEPVMIYCADKDEPVTEKIFRMIHKMPKQQNQKSLKRA
jgi:hypothetical protein